MREDGRVAGAADLLIHRGGIFPVTHLQRQALKAVAAGDFVLIEAAWPFDDDFDPFIGRYIDDLHQDDPLGGRSHIDLDTAIGTCDNIGIGTIFITEKGPIVANRKTA